jgi:hypothetical protein
MAVLWPPLGGLANFEWTELARTGNRALLAPHMLPAIHVYGVLRIIFVVHSWLALAETSCPGHASTSWDWDWEGDNS